MVKRFHNGEVLKIREDHSHESTIFCQGDDSNGKVDTNGNDIDQQPSNNDKEACGKLNSRGNDSKQRSSSENKTSVGDSVPEEETTGVHLRKKTCYETKIDEKMNQRINDNFKPLLSINGETKLSERKNSQEKNGSGPQILIDTNAPVSAKRSRKDDPRGNNDSGQQPVRDRSTNDDKQSKKMDIPKINEPERNPAAPDGKKKEKDSRHNNDLLRFLNDAGNADNLDNYPSYSKSLHIIWYCPFKARKPIFPTKIKYLADGTVKRILGRKPFRPHLHTLIYSPGRIHPGVQKMGQRATSPVPRLERQNATGDTAVPVTSSNSQKTPNPTQEATRSVSNLPSIVRTTDSVSGSQTSSGQVNAPRIKDQQCSNSLAKPGIPVTRLVIAPNQAQQDVNRISERHDSEVQVPRQVSGGTAVPLPSLNPRAIPNNTQVATHVVSHLPSQGQTVVPDGGVHMSDHRLNTSSHQPSLNSLIQPDIPISLPMHSQVPYQPRQGVNHISGRLGSAVPVPILEQPRLECHFGSDGNYHYWWQYPIGNIATDTCDAAPYPWSTRPVNPTTYIPNILPRVHDQNTARRTCPNVEELPPWTQREKFLLRNFAAIENRMLVVENRLGVRAPNTGQPQNQDTQSEAESTDSEYVEESPADAVHGTQRQPQHLNLDYHQSINHHHQLHQQQNDRDFRSSIPIWQRSHDTSQPTSQAPTDTFRGAQPRHQLWNAQGQTWNTSNLFDFAFQERLGLFDKRVTHVEQRLDALHMRPTNHARHDEGRDNLQEVSEPEFETESMPQAATEAAYGYQPQPRLINVEPPNYDLQRPNIVHQQRINILPQSFDPDLHLIDISQRKMNCVDQFVLRRTYLRPLDLPQGGKMRIQRRRRSFDSLLPEFAPNINLDSAAQASTNAVQGVHHLNRPINIEQESDTNKTINPVCQQVNVENRSIDVSRWNNVNQQQINDRQQPMDVDQLTTTVGNRPINNECRPLYRRSLNVDHPPAYMLQMPTNVDQRPTIMRQHANNIEERPLSAEQRSLNFQPQSEFSSRNFKYQTRSLNPPPGKIYAEPRIFASKPIQPRLNCPERGIHFEPRLPNTMPQSMDIEQRPMNVGQQPMNVDQRSINIGQCPCNVGQRPTNFEQRPIIVGHQAMNIEQHSLNAEQQTMNMPPRLDFPSRDINIQPPSFDSPPRRIHAQPQILDSFSIQPRPLDTPPREINSLNVEQRTMNMPPRLDFPSRDINIQRRSFDSPPRRIHAQPQILDSFSIQPQQLDTPPREIEAHPETINYPVQEIRGKLLPHVMELLKNFRKQSENSVEKRRTDIEHSPLNSEQQPMTDHDERSPRPDFPSTDINVQPRSLSSPPQVIHTQTRVLDSPPRDIIIQPQALDSPPREIAGQPESLNCPEREVKADATRLKCPELEKNADPTRLNSPEREINADPTQLNSSEREINAGPTRLNSPVMQENIQLPTVENIHLSLLALRSMEIDQPQLIEQMEVNIHHSPLNPPHVVEQPLVSPEEYIQSRSSTANTTSSDSTASSVRNIQGRQLNTPPAAEHIRQRLLETSPMLENIRPWLSPPVIENIIEWPLLSPPMPDINESRLLDSPPAVENIQPWY